MDEIQKGDEFWFPPEFLTDDDIIGMMAKENFTGNQPPFPNHFPYELPDPETDVDDLSFQFSRSSLDIPQKFPFIHSSQEAKWVYSCSPRSTLTAAGSSWSSVEEDTWDLIHGAADQVSRTNMSLRNRDIPNRSLFPQNYLNNGASHSTCHHYHSHLPQMCPEVPMKQGFPIWGKPEREPQMKQSRGFRVGFETNGFKKMGSPQVWPPCQQVQNNRQIYQIRHQTKAMATNNRAVFLSGHGRGVPDKRGCAGTGVFIPRNHELPRKPALSAPKFPARVYRPKTPTTVTDRLDPNLTQNHDLLIAWRNAVMKEVVRGQERRNIQREAMMNREEVILPQEWTY